MARYIDANKLIEAILDSLGKDTHRTIEASLVHRQEHHHLLHIITKQPTADVDEVRHGRWLVTDSFDHHKTPIYQCSVCRKEVADNYINMHKHCLHCGAKMDGGKEECLKH